MIQWLKKMDWLTIRSLGKVTYFNLSYAVIIGIPLLAESYKAVYSALNKVEISISFPTTLKILYLSSLCYAIAIAIYQYCCPKIIKQFETEQEYVDASLNIFERAYPDKKLNIVLTNLTTLQNDLKNEIVNLSGQIKLSSGKKLIKLQENLNNRVELVYLSCVQRFLLNQYETERNSKRPAIYMSGFFYFVATLLMVYLIIHKTQVVFSA